jgi:competence protein ComEA
MRLKKTFDSFFVLSKSERNGAFVLFALVLLLIFFRFIIPALYQNDKRFETDYDQRIGQLEKIKDSLNKMNSHPKTLKSTSHSRYEVKKEGRAFKEDNLKNIPEAMFQFDPNRVTLEELIRVGFSAYAAKNLINYREKGGFIRKKEDLKKIYGVDSVLYTNIEPYLTITSLKPDNKILIEINNADSADFTSLKGIGPVYAARICKYRNYLGGFVSLDQLKEVYNFPEETYLAIRDFLTLDETKVQKININFSDVKDLRKHPYCGYENARKIIDYRSGKGYIQTVEQLLHDSILGMAVFNRLSPYLKVQ